MASRPLEDCLLVFDLDGTLVDTAPDLVRALNAVLEMEGLEPIPLASMRPHISEGAKAMIARGAWLQERVYTPARLQALSDALVEIYAGDIAAQSAPFPGLIEALDAAEAMGARFSICTNKISRLALQLLDALELTHRFQAVVGKNDVVNRKPHKDHYLEAVSRAGGRIERSMMIGDSAPDLETARAAGAPAALVAFGYTNIAPEALGPDAIISHFSELPNTAAKLLRRDGAA